MNDHTRHDKPADPVRDALENLLIALAMGWDLEGVILQATKVLEDTLPEVAHA